MIGCSSRKETKMNLNGAKLHNEGNITVGSFVFVILDDWRGFCGMVGRVVSSAGVETTDSGYSIPVWNVEFPDASYSSFTTMDLVRVQKP
jgi:hypothetical protein